MRKNLLLVLVLLVSVSVFCTGCIKSSYNINIDDKDNVSISKTQAFNLSFFENYDPGFKNEFEKSVFENEEDFKKDGYDVAEYYDGTYRGITISKKNINFEKTGEEFEDAFTDVDEAFTIERRGFSKFYKIHLVYDSNKAMEQLSKQENSFQNEDIDEENSFTINGKPDKVVSKTTQTDPNTGDVTETTYYASGAVSTSSYNPQQQKKFGEALGNYFNSVPGLKPISEITIKIPKKAVKNNATKVISDTEYYWDLSDTDSKNSVIEVILEYEKFDFSSLGPVISVLIIAVIMGAVFIMFKHDGN